MKEKFNKLLKLDKYSAKEQFCKCFDVPDTIKSNQEFKTFIGKITNFSGNAVTAGNDITTLGTIEQEKWFHAFRFRVTSMKARNRNYRIGFTPEKSNRETMSFCTYKENSKKSPARLITAVQKNYYDNSVFINYYQSAVDNRQQSEWLATDVINFNSFADEYSHTLLIQDKAKKEFKIKSFYSEKTLIDLASVTGTIINGEKIFGKEGHELNSADILNIYATIKKLEESDIGKIKNELGKADQYEVELIA